jgi:NADP-dependent 3-hydroxy acid dehydrogenase YdfG
VETEFSLVRFRGDEERASQVYAGYKPLDPEDIADAVLYAATRPPHVNVDKMVVKPTDQARVGMIARRE